MKLFRIFLTRLSVYRNFGQSELKVWWRYNFRPQCIIHEMFSNCPDLSTSESCIALVTFSKGCQFMWCRRHFHLKINLVTKMCQTNPLFENSCFIITIHSQLWIADSFVLWICVAKTFLINILTQCCKNIA